MSLAFVRFLRSVLIASVDDRHHHVESVHFTTSSRQLLHYALAVVQTPSREYFVLRDTGMQVGTEEEGVSALWMEVLGCNSQGLPVSV